MSISSPFNPASPQALDTLRLFILVLILMAASGARISRPSATA